MILSSEASSGKNDTRWVGDRGCTLELSVWPSVADRGTSGGSQVESVTQRRFPFLPPLQLLELSDLQLAYLHHLDLIGRLEAGTEGWIVIRVGKRSGP